MTLGQGSTIGDMNTLDRLREFGVSQRSVPMERDLWILPRSVSPKDAAIWIADKRDAMGDPEFRALYLKYDAAFGSPGQPACRRRPGTG